jgi:hypothetical protein
MTQRYCVGYRALPIPYREYDELPRLMLLNIVFLNNICSPPENRESAPIIKIFLVVAGLKFFNLRPLGWLHRRGKMFGRIFFAVVAVVATILSVSHAFSPVRKMVVPRVQRTSFGPHTVVTRDFRFFASEDDEYAFKSNRKITRDDEGEYFESEVSN